MILRLLFVLAVEALSQHKHVVVGDGLKSEPPTVMPNPPAAQPVVHTTAGSCTPYPLCDPNSTEMTRLCPQLFSAVFRTTAGQFAIEVNSSWAPFASQRFYNLVRLGWYNDTYFFRVIRGFVNEFGLSGNPALQRHYCNDMTCSAAALDSGAAVVSDGGPLVGQGNLRGTVAFSLMATGGNARSVGEEEEGG